MSYVTNPLVGAVVEPPIAAVREWIADCDFPPDAPLIDLAQGEPAYPPPRALRDHLAETVAQPESARYTPVPGLEPLRAALAADIGSAYGGDVDARQVLVTAGCNQAFCLAVMALAQAGDEVILPAPYYFNHRMWLDMLGVRAVLLPLHAERGAVPDPADAAARIGPRTRAIVLVTPNNPTGAVYPPEVVDAFFELARSHGVALVIDETYRDFVDREGAPHGLFARPDWDETLVHLYSFSKVFALTGYRVGAVVCGRALFDEIAKTMDCVAICAPRIGQEAALFGLEHLDAWRTEKRRAMRVRAVALRQAFRLNALRYELVSIGGFFAYVRHPFAGETAEAVGRRLARDHGLLCLPGSTFGPDQDAYLRLAFANVGVEMMPEVARRLAASEAAGGSG